MHAVGVSLGGPFQRKLPVSTTVQQYSTDINLLLLPFCLLQDMGGDPEQEYFADGITE